MNATLAAGPRARGDAPHLAAAALPMIQYNGI